MWRWKHAYQIKNIYHGDLMACYTDMIIRYIIKMCGSYGQKLEKIMMHNNIRWLRIHMQFVIAEALWWDMSNKEKGKNMTQNKAKSIRCIKKAEKKAFQTKTNQNHYKNQTGHYKSKQGRWIQAKPYKPKWSKTNKPYH